MHCMGEQQWVDCGCVSKSNAIVQAKIVSLVSFFFFWLLRFFWWLPMPKWMACSFIAFVFPLTKWGFGFEHLLEWNNHAYGVFSITEKSCLCMFCG